MNLQTARALWLSFTISPPILAAMSFFLAGVGPSEIQMSRAAPTTFGVSGVVWLLSFVALAASFAVPRLIARSTSQPLTPVLVSFALSQTCAVLGLLSASFLEQPAIPEWVLLPAGAAFVVILSRFPTEASMRVGQSP